MRWWIGVITCSAWLAACTPTSPPLIDDQDIVGDGLPTALTKFEGVEARGEQIFTEREAGHCVLCHRVDGLEVEFQGSVGPDLTLVGGRLSPAQLRLRIVDYQKVVPGALMPSYYRLHDLYRVEPSYRGATILSAQQVEDLVAYLGSLSDEM